MSRPCDVVDQRRFTDSAVSPMRVQFPVEGMTCASCVTRIERCLKDIEGVQIATASLATERVTVTFDAAHVALDDLGRAIDAAGYEARLDQVDEATHPKRPSVVVEARGEAFRVVQLEGQLLVCTKEGGSCCCGHGTDGRTAIDRDVWVAEWTRRRLRNRVHLAFTGCLGTCVVGDSAMLMVRGLVVGLKELNDDRLVPAVWDYVEAVLADQATAPPPALAPHIYPRFVQP